MIAAAFQCEREKVSLAQKRERWLAIGTVLNRSDSGIAQIIYEELRWRALIIRAGFT